MANIVGEMNFGVVVQKCSECTHNLMCSECTLPNQVEDQKKQLEEYAQTIVAIEKRYNDLLESSQITVEMLMKSRAEIIREFAEKLNEKMRNRALFSVIDTVDEVMSEMDGET